MRFFLTTDKKEPLGSTHAQKHTYGEYKNLFHGYALNPNTPRSSALYNWRQDRKKLPEWLEKHKQIPEAACEQYFLEKVAEYHTLSERYHSLHTYLTYVIAAYKAACSSLYSSWLFG